MKQKTDNSVLRWIFSVAGAGRKWVALKTLLRMCQGLAGIGYAYALRSVVDTAVAGNKDAFWQHLWLFAALVLCTLVLLALTRYADEKARAILEKEYRMRFFSQLLHRDYAAVTQTHSGDWMSRLTSDTAVVVNAVSSILPELSGAVVRLLGALICLWLTVPQVVLILLPWGAVMVIVSHFLRVYLKKLHTRVQQADSTARSFLQERLYSLLVVHAFNREDITEENARAHLDNLVHARMRKNRFVNLSSTAMGAAVWGAQVIGIGMCCHSILENTMTYGTVSAVLYLVNMLEGPLVNMTSFLPAYYAMIASAERLMELEDYPMDASEAPADADTVRSYYAEQFSALGLENACFAYEDDPSNAVLQGLELQVQKGEFVAFTGESGCGKTTTLKVLLNLYPLNSGSAYLLDADGTRRALNGNWRSLFAYVPQGNQLTYGTVRQTLCFSDPKLMADEEALKNALRIACAEDFVSQLPQGLDTVLGERGAGLSEGQLQRLAIARALLTQRPVLLLDEATSALDAATEEALMQNLRSMTDRTVLIITHRESVLSHCDKHIHFKK